MRRVCPHQFCSASTTLASSLRLQKQHDSAVVTGHKGTSCTERRERMQLQGSKSRLKRINVNSRARKCFEG